MIAKKLAILIGSVLLIQGCSTLGLLSGTKKIETVSKPVCVESRFPFAFACYYHYVRFFMII